jgi:oxygen-independent coproporphyrinogen-3 oxidase
MSWSAPPWREPRTAYVHIPFCAHQCGYCDFAVAAGQDHLVELYLDALDIELQTLDRPRPVETIFIGGGTPTHIAAEQLARLLSSLRSRFPFAGTHPEFSIESTPDSLTREKVAVLAEFGVNRVSIGVQSFHGGTLEALDRRHGVEQIATALSLVRERIPSVSLDLIFGAPGQSPADWERDLDSALALEPDHLSTYGLTFEKGTPLWKDRERGRIRPVSETDELTMYELAIDRLTATGFEHYEISNFARPGSRCRHNERYWANDAYHGVGVGAARYVDGTRSLNIRDTRLYIRTVLAGESPAFQSERLAPREEAFETLAIQLRRSDGIDRNGFRERTGFDLDLLISAALPELVRNDLLVDEGGRVRLTRRGKCLADGIVECLLAEQ